MSKVMEKTGKDTYLQHLPTIAKGAGIIFFGTIIGKALILVFTLLIAKLLNTEQVGLYFLGLSVVTIASIPALLGLDSGIVRFVALYKGTNDDGKIKGTVISAVLMVIPLSFLIAFVLFFSSDKIATVFFHKPELSNVLRPLSIAVPFIALAAVFISTTQALKFMQYKVFAKDLADNILKTLVALVLLVLGFGLNGVVFATVIAAVMVAIISFYYSNKLISLFDSNKPVFEFRSLLSFSVPQSFSSLIVISMLYVDILILGYFMPASVVGIYSIAAKVSLIGILVISSFNAIFAPMIADLYNRSKLDVLSDLFKTVTKWIFSISFPVFLILVFLAKPILSIFGNEYIAGATALIILSVGQLINAASGPVGLMIVMSGRPGIELLSNVVVFILNITLNLLLIPKYGIEGAAIATAVSISTMNIIRLLAVRFIMDIHPYKLSFYKPLLAAIIPSAGLVIGSGLVGYAMILLAVFFLLLYLSFLYLLGIESEDGLIIKSAIDKLPFPN
ncbi:MAG TPA: flippase [Actinobacteria bacterium]|nr:flippase [Actinomycetota bacterium]